MSDPNDDDESEEAIVARIKRLLTIEENDNIRKIRTVYQPMGRELAIAKERGYTDKLGVKGWFFVKFQRHETTAYGCLHCWEDRFKFEDALDWVAKGNSGYYPGKKSGPQYCRELCNAYDDRALTEAEKLAKRGNRRKALTPKQLKQELAKWHNRYERVKNEHLEWAEQHEREPRIIHQIEQEIAAEKAAEQAAAAAVEREPDHYPDEGDGADADEQRTSGAEPEPEADLDDAVNDNVEPPEPEVDTTDPNTAEAPEPEPEPDVVVDADCQRTRDAESEPEPEPDVVADTSRQRTGGAESEPEQQHTNTESEDFTPWVIRLGDAPRPDGVAVLAAIERRWSAFVKSFGGGNVKPERRMLARINRARALMLLDQNPDDAIANYIGKLPFRVWLRDDIEDLSIQMLVDLRQGEAP